MQEYGLCPLAKSTGVRVSTAERRRPRTPPEAEVGGPRPPGCRAASALSLLPQPCGAWGLRVWAEGGEVAGGACAARLAADCRSGGPTAEGPGVSGPPRCPPVVTALGCKAACFGQGSATDARGYRCECKSSVRLRDTARRHAGSDPVNKVRRPRL